MIRRSKKWTLQLVIILVSVTLLSGCLGGIDGTGTTTDSTTTGQIHATGEMMEIIDHSDRVENVLVNDTYTYKTGRYNGENGTAVAYIRTGQSGTGKGGLYKIRMNVTNENVTSIEKVYDIQLTTQV